MTFDEWLDSTAPNGNPNHFHFSEREQKAMRIAWDAALASQPTICDHSGSSSSVSTDGTYRFQCSKCGTRTFLSHLGTTHE